MPRQVEPFTPEEQRRINRARILLGYPDFTMSYADFIHDAVLAACDEVENATVWTLGRRVVRPERQEN